MKSLWCVLVAAALCGTAAGWIKEYIAVSTRMNWTDAQRYCRDHYSDLATITTDKANQQLLDLNGFTSTNNYIWIGLYRAAPFSDTWLWSDGGPVIYFDWGRNQPDNAGGHENCGSIYSGGWNDFDCSSKRSFNCYRNVVLVEEQKTWEEALQYCRKFYTDLYSPVSDLQIRLDQLETVKPQTLRVWTALRFVDGKWLWLSGWSVKGTESLASCPARRYSCGAQNSGTSVWENTDCSEKLNVLCY